MNFVVEAAVEAVAKVCLPDFVFHLFSHYPLHRPRSLVHRPMKRLEALGFYFTSYFTLFCSNQVAHFLTLVLSQLQTMVRPICLLLVGSKYYLMEHLEPISYSFPRYHTS
jgi:hypothetical protein